MDDGEKYIFLTNNILLGMIQKVCCLFVDPVFFTRVPT